MSVIRVTSSWLSLKPQIDGDEETLICETSRLAKLLTLWASHRRIVVDRRSRTVTIETRGWWSEGTVLEIPFEGVDHIEYEFYPVPANRAWGSLPIEVEWFTVSLAMRTGGDAVQLTAFAGEVSELTDRMGTIVGDVSLLPAGDQEDASRRFVVALKRLLDVPIGIPVPHVADERGVRYRCMACTRPSPPRRAKCQYCGGPVSEEPAVAKGEGGR